MGQLKFRFQIPGTGRFLGMGQVSHNPALGGSEVHGFQSASDGLVGTPVQNPDQKAVICFQKGHLLINVACYILF